MATATTTTTTTTMATLSAASSSKEYLLAAQEALRPGDRVLEFGRELVKVLLRKACGGVLHISSKVADDKAELVLSTASQ